MEVLISGSFNSLSTKTNFPCIYAISGNYESETHKYPSAKGLKRTEETRRKMSEAQKGRTFSQETLLKFVEVQKKRSFIIKSPCGEIISAQGVKLFCRENDLHQTNFRKLLNNKIKSYKGWTLP